MTFTRVALAAGALIVLAGFGVLVAAGVPGAATAVVTLTAVVVLIGCGNLMYGKSSHGAAAQARVRPAQDAQNRAIDEAHAHARQQRTQARQGRVRRRARSRRARSRRARQGRGQPGQRALQGEEGAQS